MRTLRTFTPALFVVLLFGSNALGQDTRSGDQDAASTIAPIYDDISSDGSTPIDWEKIKAYFAEDALISLRTSRDGNSQFSVDEFIQDFKDFYSNPAVAASGFKEEVLRIDSREFKDIAFVDIVYSATILNSERPPQKGIDYWLLTRINGVWKVTSIVNDVLMPGEDVPEID